MKQAEITIGDETLPVTIVRKKMKNIYLYVLPPDGGLKITCPKSVSDEEIFAFLKAKHQWISEKRKKVQATPSTNSLFGEMGNISLLGMSYPVVTLLTPGKNAICVENGIVTMTVKNNSKAEQEALILSLYRSELGKALHHLVPKWESIMGVGTTFVGMRKMHTRWGSCIPTKRRLWFSLYLGAKGFDAIEYVVVHELAHLLEPSHNKRFYSIMSQFLPDWKEGKSQLNIR